MNIPGLKTLRTAAALSAAMLACTAWADLTPPSYRYYRFKVEATKDASVGMMQFSELKLYNGDTEVTSQGTLLYEVIAKPSSVELSGDFVA